MHIYTKKKKKKKEEEEETRHIITHGNGNTCKREGHTSNLGSSSKMGQVVDVSFLCLNCKKRKKKKKKKREISKYSYGVSRRKALQNRKKMKKK